MLINAFTVLKNLENFRVCWLGGRYGSHKTALAFRLAYELWQNKRVDRILSNCESVWNDDPETLQLESSYKINAAIIFDEGGLIFDNRGDVKTVLAGLRKMNTVILIPSVQAPSTRMRFFEIQMIYSMKPLGLPLLIYRSNLMSGAVRDVTYFAWWKPDVYGVYNTLDFPVDAEKLMAFLTTQKDQIASGTRKYSESRATGRQRYTYDLPEGFGEVAPSVAASQLIEEEVNAFEEVADRIEETFSGADSRFKVTRKRGLFN